MSGRLPGSASSDRGFQRPRRQPVRRRGDAGQRFAGQGHSGQSLEYVPAYGHVASAKNGVKPGRHGAVRASYDA